MGDDLGEEVKKLVRKLSTNSLAALATNVDEHKFPDAEDFGDEDPMTF